MSTKNTSNDIKQMLADSYHEIYDQPMDVDALDDIFQTETADQFSLDSIEYEAAKVYTYISQFLEQVKHSFANPVTHHMDNGTQLNEVNSLLHRFNLFVQLYHINQGDLTQDDEIVGKKRKQTKQKTGKLTPYFTCLYAL